MKISEMSNCRILEKWLKFPSSHSDQRNRLLNFTHAFFCRFKDLEPMLNLPFPYAFQDREYEETKPGQGAKTSDYYDVKNIPPRFDNPGKP